MLLRLKYVENSPVLNSRFSCVTNCPGYTKSMSALKQSSDNILLHNGRDLYYFR
jgi:hypothetical protein